MVRGGTKQYVSVEERALLSMAACLGMEPHRDKALLWIARSALEAPLPTGWAEAEDGEGTRYFYDRESGETSWQLPTDDYYRQVARARVESVRIRAKGQRSPLLHPPPLPHHHPHLHLHPHQLFESKRGELRHTALPASGSRPVSGSRSVPGSRPVSGSTVDRLATTPELRPGSSGSAKGQASRGQLNGSSISARRNFAVSSLTGAGSAAPTPPGSARSDRPRTPRMPRTPRTPRTTSASSSRFGASGRPSVSPRKATAHACAVIARIAPHDLESAPMWQRDLLRRATMTMIETRQEKERKLSGQVAHKGAKFFPKESFFPPPLPLPGWQGNASAANSAAAAVEAGGGGGGEATEATDTAPPRSAGIYSHVRNLVQPLEESVQKLVFEVEHTHTPIHPTHPYTHPSTHLSVYLPVYLTYLLTCLAVIFYRGAFSTPSCGARRRACRC